MLEAHGHPCEGWTSDDPAMTTPVGTMPTTPPIAPPIASPPAGTLPAAAPIAQFEQVGLRHGDDGADVLKAIDITVQAGGFHLLTGPSGAGKTAFLDLLALARQPTQGTVRLFGQDVAEVARDDLPALRRRIGTVHQDGRLLAHLSVADNVALPLRIAGWSAAAIQAAVPVMLDRMGLRDRMTAAPATLSAGERQQAAIARAAVIAPALILADEPSGDVDPATADRLLFLLGTLASPDTAVVVATHDSRLFMRVPAARIWRLEGGRLHDPAARPARAVGS
jgi:cell division transport system ATP-binding protein